MPSIGDTCYTGENLVLSDACRDDMVLIITLSSIIQLCFMALLCTSGMVVTISHILEYLIQRDTSQ